MKIVKLLFICVLTAALSACDDDKDHNKNSTGELSEEYYSGGLLGTIFNETPYAYEQPAPAVEKQGFGLAFIRGEDLFEKEFNTNTSGVRHGLGPVSVRSSCLACHPGYGHGKRMDRYKANDYGNGYLLVVTDENDNYVTSLTGMPQVQAVYPFLPPVIEDKIKIEWKSYNDEWGNKFDDGETYSLIYPDVTIPRDGFNVELPDFYEVRLEATIGIYGTGLIDAIPDDSLLAQYEYEKLLGLTLNDAKYAPVNFIKENDGTSHPGRYTYGLTRGTLQNGPGANAIWNITNVTRSNRQYHYITDAYASAMSKRTEIQTVLGKTEQEIYDYLMSKTLEPEMTDEDYVNFMVWHRGLAVPAARNLDDVDVQKGKALFSQAGCTACHRPSWTTGADNYTGDTLVAGNKLPRYPYQKIYPYSDLIQHRLFMENDIRTGWCRTTPLWGRGLSEKCTGAGEHLHDMRARNYTEAIMWHGAQQSDARKSIEKFRMMSKEERAAIVKFLEAI
ncbi:MAG: c-type cytochrome [Dysgonamonadaceae bacterium]|nr:c-type cytochrome [Dysgonamonadaceae bacterium]